MKGEVTPEGGHSGRRGEMSRVGSGRSLNLLTSGLSVLSGRCLNRKPFAYYTAGHCTFGH